MISNILKWIDSIKDTDKIVFAEYDSEAKIMKAQQKNGLILKFKGSSTVWSYYPSMISCGTLLDSKLLDIYKYIQEHGNPYPESHINNEL